MNTPRTDAATRMSFSGEYMVPIQDAQKLETELVDMRTQFADYVQAEDEWMESMNSFCSEDKRKQYRIKASELREKAKEVLGL
jgi:hypothetical protein